MLLLQANESEFDRFIELTGQLANRFEPRDTQRSMAGSSALAQTVLHSPEPLPRSHENSRASPSKQEQNLTPPSTYTPRGGGAPAPHSPPPKRMQMGAGASLVREALGEQLQQSREQQSSASSIGGGGFVRDALAEQLQQSREQQDGRQAPLSLSRWQQLQNLFGEMDLDNSGFIEADEVNQLAQMRRALHQKKGDKMWNDAMNNRLLMKIDANGDGQIQQAEFVDHYLGLFENQDDRHFDTWVEQFRQVVQELHCIQTPPPTPPKIKSPPHSQQNSRATASKRDQIRGRSESTEVSPLWEGQSADDMVASMALAIGNPDAALMLWLMCVCGLCRCYFRSKGSVAE